LNKIIELDQQLFHYINTTMTDPFWNKIAPVLTDLHKQPLVMTAVFPLALAIWFWYQRGRAVKTLFLIILSVGMSDALCYRVIKPMVNRARPMDAGIEVQLRTTPHSGKSFPSNHAANNFSAATILSIVYPEARLIFFLAATVVALSRVYVGVHFPLDVFAGAIIGMIIALLVMEFFGDRWIGRQKESRRRKPWRDAMTTPRKKKRYEGF
jgi:undecaprenyl-diphosphatase